MTGAPPRRAGTVVWVDLSTPDLDRAIHFYERLFGWHYDETDSPMGMYVVAETPTGEVGGMMGQPSEQAALGVPAMWSVAVGTDDIATTVTSARALGGSVLQPPSAIPGGARIAVIADPAGAALALMQSPPSGRSMAWGGPGAVSWVECLSRDPAASRRFHESLFGWTSEEGPGGYVVFEHDGERVGGLLAMPANVPPDAPSNWMVYFGVPDVAAASALAAEHGGMVLESPHEIDEGRFAVLTDPSGAVFAVFEDRSS